MIEPVGSSDRAWDDIGIGLGELEGVGLENEAIGVEEKTGFGKRVVSGELDPPKTPGFPVDAIGGNFNGEDGVGTEFRLEKLKEFFCYDGLGNIGDPQCQQPVIFFYLRHLHLGFAAIDRLSVRVSFFSFFF